MASLCKEEVVKISDSLQHRLLQELRKNGIQFEQIIAVKIIGSTLWCTRNDQSDYDVYVIHDSDAKHLKNNKVCVSCREFDLQLCDIDEFKLRLNDHEISSVLLKYHPKELNLFINPLESVAVISKERNEVITDLFEQYKITPNKLLDAVCKETNKDWKRAIKLFASNDFQHAVKVSTHAFRSFMLATQLVENGEVVDWKCANDLNSQLLSLSCDDMEDYVTSHLQPLFNDYKFKLINVVKPSEKRATTSVSGAPRKIKMKDIDGEETSVLFSKYEKMAHCSSKCVGEKLKGQYVVTEKVHGCNFSIICSGEVVVYGRRSGVISDGEDFYGYLSHRIPENHSPKARELFKLLNRSTTLPDGVDIEQIQVIGELFGGYYPQQEKSLFGPVQTGVWYTDKLEYMVFDIAVTYSNGDRQYLNFNECKEYSELAGFTFVPVLFIGSYEDAVAYPHRFNSKVPQLLGMPDLGEDMNLAEGVVIKCCEEGIHSAFTSRVIFKHKIDEFSEKKYQTSKVEFKQKMASRDLRACSEEEKGGTGGKKLQKAEFKVTKENKMELLKFEMWACLTESRLQSVLSKIGRVDWKKKEECLEVLKLYVQDIIADLDEEERTVFQGLGDAERKDLLKMLREDVKLVIRDWAKAIELRR